MAKLRKRMDRNGKYFVDYYDVDGQRYRVSTDSADRNIGELWLAEIKKQLALAKLGQRGRVGRFTVQELLGIHNHSGAFKLNEYRAEYLERCEFDLEYSTSSINLTRNAFDSLFTVLGNRSLKSITEDDVRRWKRKIAGKLSSTTIGIYQRMLRAAFNRAVKWSYLERSPFSNVEMPKATSKRVDMSFDDVRRLLNGLGDSSFGLFVRFVLYTGCRRKEILSLRNPDDIDRVNWTIKVNAEKTGKVFLIPVNQALRRCIECTDLPNGYIFESENTPGRPWNADSVTHRFKREIRRLQLPDHYSLHSLRHSYATRLREKGVPRDIVSVLLGHSSSTTTAIYDHAKPLAYRSYADLLDYEGAIADGATTKVGDGSPEGVLPGTNRAPDRKGGGK